MTRSRVISRKSRRSVRRSIRPSISRRRRRRSLSTKRARKSQRKKRSKRSKRSKHYIKNIRKDIQEGGSCCSGRPREVDAAAGQLVGAEGSMFVRPDDSTPHDSTTRVSTHYVSPFHQETAEGVVVGILGKDYSALSPEGKRLYDELKRITPKKIRKKKGEEILKLFDMLAGVIVRELISEVSVSVQDLVSVINTYFSSFMVGDRILLAHRVILNISNRDEDFTPELIKRVKDFLTQLFPSGADKSITNYEGMRGAVVKFMKTDEPFGAAIFDFLANVPSSLWLKNQT